MKNIIVVSLLVFFAKNVFAQKDSLSFDEHDKYIYYKLVDQPGVNADTLYNRGLYFLTAAYPKKTLGLSKSDKENHSLTGVGSYMISKKALVGNSEGGEMHYTLTIEVKDLKYRYWLTDFVYQPYQRNRYGSSEPVAGGEIPLEKASAKLSKSDFSNYLDQVIANSKQVGDRLRAYMLKASSLAKKQEVKKVNKISTKEW
ncbi:DUF4468 domain-containing protein [Mucilaginibacter sp.]|uniref:DUF4468 domain-containing protein n=1 Tax=Mucilaginibacter sp. TaxID=1882438 RepID=UPI002ED33AD6